MVSVKEDRKRGLCTENFSGSLQNSQMMCTAYMCTAYLDWNTVEYTNSSNNVSFIQIAS